MLWRIWLNKGKLLLRFFLSQYIFMEIRICGLKLFADYKLQIGKQQFFNMWPGNQTANEFCSQTSTQMTPYNMKNWFVGPNTDFWENISGTVKKICGTQIG